MIDYRGESDIETSGEILNSGQSSMSSGSSFGRLSFDSPAGSSTPAPVKPHRASDSFAVDAVRSRGGGLTFRDFELLRRIGGGDIGRVYLCRRRSSGESEGSDEVFAMKVVDKGAVALKKKSHRAEMEKKILEMVDHPFLPRLHAVFEDSHFSCIVMEFCPGGDLHGLRHRQPHKRFSFSSARFYAAEVLLALEYLHLMGIIYRDLKPENVLVRSDGHIMLSDFDLSFYSQTTIPTVQSPDSSPPRRTRPQRIRAQLSCFPRHRLFRSHKVVGGHHRMFVAEPVEARSWSFVGTHEYVAPEVASGGAHGSAVDWWALGIFIYEMIYGRTPFAGGSNDATLRSVLKEPLGFPVGATPPCEGERRAQSFISGLLAKDPDARLGSKRGAAEVKTHPFFSGLNFALVRSVAPPVVPGPWRGENTASSSGGRSSPSLRTETTPPPSQFDYF